MAASAHKDDDDIIVDDIDSMKNYDARISPPRQQSLSLGRLAQTPHLLLRALDLSPLAHTPLLLAQVPLLLRPLVCCSLLLCALMCTPLLLRALVRTPLFFLRALPLPHLAHTPLPLAHLTEGWCNLGCHVTRLYLPLVEALDLHPPDQTLAYFLAQLKV